MTHSLSVSRLTQLALAGLFAGASLPAQSTDWPAQSGPNFDYSYAAPAGVMPAKSLSDIDLIWDSTAYFGSGATSREWTPSGGCATPIVYQDRVYLWWMSPDLDVDVFDPASEIRKIPEEFGSYKDLYRLLDNAVSTNNHIVCIDANTGETLWERVFPATGINQVGHKETINNHTMAAADGKVFACGSDQRIYALDALTGELLWVAKNISWQSVQEIRVDALQSGKQFKSDRMWNNHLLAVDGVVVAGDNREWGNLTGFDAQTGAKLWQLSGITYGRTNPDVWKHAGRNYLVVGDNDGFSLVDPISGQILWQHTGTGPGGMSSTVQGDTFFTNLLPGSPIEGDDQGIMGCFQLSLAGPTLLWQAPQADGFPQAKNAGVFVHDGKVFLRSNYQIHVYNLADGSKITAIPLGDIDSGNAIQFRINDLLYSVIDSQHSDYATRVIDMNTVQTVGSFTLSNLGLSYSSQLLPVPYKDRLLLRRSYGRLSCLTFSQTQTPDVEVTLDQPIAVVAQNEAAQFTATVQTVPERSVTEVRFLVDGEIIHTDATAPYEFSHSEPLPGTHRVEAVAIDDLGASHVSYHRFMEVVDWEVIVLPRDLDMRVGQARRFIPIAINRATGYMLPQQFQALNMGNYLDNTYDPPFVEITTEIDAAFRATASFIAAGGTVETGLTIDPENGNLTYGRWGAYTPDTPGDHPIVVSITHNGVTRSGTATAHVRAASETFSQHFIDLYPQPVRDAGSNFFLGSAWSSHRDGAVYTVISGPGTLSNPTWPRVTSTGPGAIVYEVYHPGDADYLPSDPVTGVVYTHNSGATLLPQSISFDPVPDQVPSADPFPIAADSESPEPVVLSVISGPAYLDGGLIHLTGKKGRVTILAEHEGDQAYDAALPVVREFQVGSLTSIDLELLAPAGTYEMLAGDLLPVQASVNSPLSPLTQLEFLVDGEVAATLHAEPWETQIAGLTPGAHAVRARATNEAGEVEYSVQAQVKVIEFGSIQVTPAALSLIIGDSVPLSALGIGADGLPLPGAYQPVFNWSASAGGLDPATGFSTTYEASVVGEHEIQVSATVGGIYRETIVPVTVAKVPQSIDFPATGNLLVGDPPLVLAATSSSGLPVAFAVVSGPAEIQNGNELVPLAAGAVVVEATQSGDATWAAAVPVERSLTIKDGLFLTSLTLQPTTLELEIGDSIQFQFEARDQDGDLLDPSLLNLTWSVTGGGSISQSGLFTAGSVASGTHTVWLTVSRDGTTLQASCEVIVTRRIEAISINFGKTTLAADLSAGVESVAFWNNATASGTYANLTDSLGQTTGTAVTFASNFYTTADAAPITGDQLMMASYSGSLATSFLVTLSGIPSAYASATYDLIVYFGAKDSSVYLPYYSVNGQDLYIRDANGTWDGVHRESTATSSAAAVQGDNYVRFRNLSATDLVLTINKGTGVQRYGISGLQIVANQAIAPAPIPVPAMGIDMDGADWRISFLSEVDLTYQLYWTESLTGSWDPVGDPMIGDGAEIIVLIPISGLPREFFRLEIIR